MHRRKHLTILLASLGALGAHQSSHAQPENAAIFDLSRNALPYPTDLHFYASTDGTLNIAPTDGNSTLTPIQVETNALDGFSTNAVIRERFTAPLDPTSLTANAIRMFEVRTDYYAKNIVSVTRELTMGSDASSSDFVARLAQDSAGSVIELQPWKPLTTSSGPVAVGYLVVMTNAIRTAQGAAVEAGRDYQLLSTQASRCDQLTDPRTRNACDAVANQLQVAASQGVDTSNVVLTFSFSTGSHDALRRLSSPNGTPPRAISAQRTGLTNADVIPGFLGHADIYRGTLQVPYYGALPTASNPSAPLTGSWRGGPSPLDPSSHHLTRFNPIPLATGTVTIPLLATVPNRRSVNGGNKPSAGWPVIVFQHDLTSNRLDAAALADMFASVDADPQTPGVQGYMIVAIDLPLHGIAGAEATAANPLFDQQNERTFNLDLIDNEKLTPGPDGRIDPSGSHFITLSSLLTSRDNLRQAASDLLTLVRSLPNLDLDGDGVSDIDASRVHFVGHSFGGIAGGVFLANAQSTDVSTGLLANPGGGVVSTLFDSPRFGPAMKRILAAQGIEEGTWQYAEFLRDAQAITDGADPLNTIATARLKHPLLVTQIVGGGRVSGGGVSPPDQYVPNANTERLIRAAGLQRIRHAGDNAVSASYVNFVVGAHESLLDPRPNILVTREMQGEAASFAQSMGSNVRVSLDSVIQK